jgi:hypothetical protein
MIMIMKNFWACIFSIFYNILNPNFAISQTFAMLSNAVEMTCIVSKVLKIFAHATCNRPFYRASNLCWYKLSVAVLSSKHALGGSIVS